MTINPNPNEGDFVLKSKEMDLEAGFLGRCFGSRANAPMNIAGSLIFLLTISGIVVLFCSSSIPPADYWKIIVPIITLALGYVFGKGHRGS